MPRRLPPCIPQISSHVPIYPSTPLRFSSSTAPTLQYALHNLRPSKPEKQKTRFCPANAYQSQALGDPELVYPWGHGSFWRSGLSGLHCPFSLQGLSGLDGIESGDDQPCPGLFGAAWLAPTTVTTVCVLSLAPWRRGRLCKHMCMHMHTGDAFSPSDVELSMREVGVRVDQVRSLGHGYELPSAYRIRQDSEGFHAIEKCFCIREGGTTFGRVLEQSGPKESLTDYAKQALHRRV